MAGIKSDGSTASYYELPQGAKELQHLIAYKNMNAQIGEIFRAAYRYGEVEHSERLRDARKMKFYIDAEIERLLKYEHRAETSKSIGTGSKESERLQGVQEAEGEAESGGEEADGKLVICSVCDNIIDGRVYYLGNEPRCKSCAGE